MIKNIDKIKKDDRILEIKVIDDKKPLSSIGLVDKRLFKGGNSLHAVYSPQTRFWKLKYETGHIPQALENQWSSFELLLRDTDKYFRKRNLYIAQVLD